MKVYIMRHGKAEYSASSDSVRKLTAEGKAECFAVAQHFHDNSISFDLALVSPYLRAQESFAVVADIIAVNQIEAEQQLVPGGNPAHVADYLRALALSTDVQSVLIVSHLPLVGYLVHELCSAIPAPMFSTADVACVSLSKEGKGSVEWFLHQ